jgi:hypothetical protein
MHESRQEGRLFVAQEVVLQRLGQSEELRKLTIQVWLQNPSLALQAGPRIVELLKPLRTDQGL